MENYKSTESINKEKAEFIATSGLREFEPILVEAINWSVGGVEDSINNRE